MKKVNKTIKPIILTLAFLNAGYLSAKDFVFNQLNDLGTLENNFRSDNRGYSTALAVSADGRVVVGYAQVDIGVFHAYRYNEGDARMIDLGTLKSDNSGYSKAYGVSANGRVVVGHAEIDVGGIHAFRHNEGDARMTDLGTLRSDNSGNSDAHAVSADGRVVVGRAETDSGFNHAFRHNKGDARMTDLGTLKSDNSRGSYANAVSADGRVVVGNADTDSGFHHAFRHNEGDLKMTDLGTLRGDNSGNSFTKSVSADGRVVVGNAETDSGYQHAFRHNEGDLKMTDLGTLRSDNSGNSFANSVSADGRVVVGHADTDSGFHHAFRHNEGDLKMTDLGTLRSDNSGYSNTFGVSADGRVVAGNAQTDSGAYHAFRHNEGDLKMTDLGTLRGDNSGNSTALAVSADGRVVVGYAQTDSGNDHAFVYKNRMLDVEESHTMLSKGADQQTAALGFLHNKLTDALFQGCRPDTGDTCFTAGVKYYQQSNKAIDDTAAYINIAHRFQPKFYAGIYLEQSVSSGFANSIDASNEQPMVALYGGISPSGDSRLGTQIRAAVSSHKINANIIRPALVNTEAGKGSTDFKGYAGQLEVAYGIQATDNLTVSPVIGLNYSKVERGSYTEEDTVDFPARYGKMKTEQTSLYAGIKTDLSLNKKINLYTSAGLEQVLDHSEDTFSVTVPYIGGFKSSDPDVRNTRAYVFTGMSYKVAPNQKIGVGVGYRQASFKSIRDGLSAQLGYQVQF